MNLRKLKASFVLTLLAAAMCLQATAQVSYKTRAEIPAKYKWNFSDIYENWEAWEVDFKSMSKDVEQIQVLKGKLGENADNLLKLLSVQENMMKKAYKVYQFVSFQSTVDGKNMELQAKLQQVGIFFNQMQMSTTWISPEMIKIPEITMKQWIAETPA